MLYFVYLLIVLGGSYAIVSFVRGDGPRGAEFILLLRHTAILCFLCIIYVIWVSQRYQTCAIAIDPHTKQPSAQWLSDEEAEYFAIQTLTSTGYGCGINAAMNNQFYVIAHQAMIFGGILWVLGLGVASSHGYRLIQLFRPRKPPKSCPFCQKYLQCPHCKKNMEYESDAHS